MPTLQKTRLDLRKQPVQARSAASVGSMPGVSRRLLESPSTEKQLDLMRRERTVLACACLEAGRAPRPRYNP